MLFCGRDMHYGFAFTKEALQGDEGIEVVQCDREQLQLAIADAQVVVPLMCRLDAAVSVRVQSDFRWRLCRQLQAP